MATQGNNNQQGNNSGSGEKVEIDVGGAHVEITEGGQNRNMGPGQSGGTRATANNGQSQSSDTSTGHKPGAVLHPETDGRLKGNEANRPNDPDRSAQAEGGRRGGQNSHRNDGNRGNADGGDDGSEGGSNNR